MFKTDFNQDALKYLFSLVKPDALLDPINWPNMVKARVLIIELLY